MRSPSKIVLFLLVGFFLVTAILLYPKTILTSTTSQLTIVDKYEKDRQFWIQGYDPQSELKKEIKIEMVDRDEWESVTKNKTYTITYMQEENKDPVFVEFVQAR